jgi:hypothetical protein
MVIVDKLVAWRLAGETEVLGENQPQHHFAHHKSRMTRPRFEPGPPRWEASDYAWYVIATQPAWLPLMLQHVVHQVNTIFYGTTPHNFFTRLPCWVLWERQGNWLTLACRSRTAVLHYSTRKCSFVLYLVTKKGKVVGKSHRVTWKKSIM